MSRYRVLFVEDSEIDAERAIRSLTRAGVEAVVRRVESESAFRSGLDAFRPDVILSDFSLPQFNGLAALQIAQKNSPATPFIFLSGTIGQDTAIESLKQGAADYILKDNLARLPSAITRALKQADDRLAREQAEEKVRRSEARLRLFIQYLPGVAFLKHLDGRYALVNAAAEQAFGRPVEEIIGKTDDDLVADGMAAQFRAMDRLAVERGTAVQCVDAMPTPSGMRQWLTTKFPLQLEDDVVIGGVAIDVTERLAAEEALRLNERAVYQQEMEQQANHDSLTGLPNRNLLHDRLDQAILHARRNSEIFSVLLLDLDHFKSINDGLGHKVGDRVLQLVAQRLVGCVREGDTVARLGSDEFVLVLKNQLRQDNSVHVTERIAQSFTHPCNIGDQELDLTCSIGLSTYPAHGEDKETLLRNADAAMHRVKTQTRNGIHFYTDELNTVSRQRLDLVTALRRALDREEFVMHYQPQVDLRTGRIFGVEALIRWKRAGQPSISPAEFIPVAEESELIVAIGAWTLHAACLQNKRWQDAGREPMSVAVNLSAQQFRRKGIVDTVAGVLRATGLEGRYLELELSESMMMHSADQVIVTLRELKSLGVQLTVEDFGIGYSSLTYLQRFPVDRLKIDRSFVKDVGIDPGNTAIAQAIIGLGHSLQLRVIAEGVETLDRCAFLRQCECDEAQGYYFGKPLAAADLEPLLASVGRVSLSNASNLNSQPAL